MTITERKQRIKEYRAKYYREHRDYLLTKAKDRVSNMTSEQYERYKEKMRDAYYRRKLAGVRAEKEARSNV